MEDGNFAVLDLGTNTFNILIVNIDKNVKTILAQDRYAVKIGMGGIQNKVIAPEACERAIAAMQTFKRILDRHQVPLANTKATATSAFRNATNGIELANKIKELTALDIEIIDGEKEATLIYYGVKSALEIGDDISLIMDIGGGSVEFIICDEQTIFWKKSYEIGAQRLLDMFHKHDPMLPDDMDDLYHYLAVNLVELQTQILFFKPKVLIGSSGTFDTLSEIYIKEFNLDYQLETGTEFEIPIHYFGEVFYKLITKNINDRKKIPGMSPMRVDMIVVSVCLIDYILRNFYISKLRVSFYSLKEGLLSMMTSKSTFAANSH